MTPTRSTSRLTPKVVALAGLVAGVGLTLPVAAGEVVILKDGFVLQGNVRKEQATITDPATGKPFVVVKDTGLDAIDEGPKVTIFSTHSKQVGEISGDVKLRPDVKAYTTPPASIRSSDRLPSGASIRISPEFNEKWFRTLVVDLPGGTIDKINQQITYFDPYYCYIWSNSHNWRLAYRTSEMDPKRVRKLLSTHPDLAEQPGKPEAAKRVAIGRFMLDAGWLQLAREDLERIKKDFPNGVPAEAKEAYEKLVRDADVATAGLVVKEAGFALGAGRYDYAGRVLASFPEKLADAKQTAEIADMMAQWKSARERYDTGRRLLRATIDEVTGFGKATPLLGVGGGPALAAWRPVRLSTPSQTLADAAEEVYRSVHPDSARRLEVFVNLALQVERDRAQGRGPSKKPEELLAAAVSGWAKGNSGATPDVDKTLKVWAAREAVLNYQRADDLNHRNEIMAAFKQRQDIALDELALIVSLLPPAEPEDLLFRTGTMVEAKKGIPAGVYQRKTPGTPAHPEGLSYYVKLPPEYHHGRAYPVLIVLSPPALDPEQVLGSIANEADKQGYILLAPDWGNLFGKPWQWQGEDHEYVTAALRDAVRHFCIDNDRVFLLGAGDGGSMAMDVGTSHPDLFAGVLAMGAEPRWQNMLIHYWKNAQKLPFYVVTGELAGDAPKNLKLLYQQWARYGFPGLLVVYKGRGMEWYAAEVPVMFDWMSRKKRVSAKATLKLEVGGRYPWTTMRATDDHFYWLSVDEIDPRRDIANLKSGLISPATITADVGGNNVINVSTLGVRRFSVWLSDDMIDWTKPIAVNVNSKSVPAWRNKKIQPDLGVLLEDYRVRSDRRMLYLQRLELAGSP
ncbi:MAG TPA: PHB depolymerase family esterase [Gemmata sp.]|nr:PHB depolymerase family esterase [Gemmata sp.]